MPAIEVPFLLNFLITASKSRFSKYNMNHWQDYVRAAYDLILESEGQNAVYLDNEVETYVVHMFAKNFLRTNIGEQPIAIQILTTDNYQPVADECLLINSYPLKRRRWPSDTYYIEMGKVAYGLANIEIMEANFEQASRVLHSVLRRIG